MKGRHRSWLAIKVNIDESVVNAERRAIDCGVRIMGELRLVLISKEIYRICEVKEGV